MLEGAPYAEFEFFRRRRADGKVWIETPTRVDIIKRGLDVAGSMNNLGRMMGYRSRRHPGWCVRQILYGFQPFSMERLEKLADIIHEPVAEILQHSTEERYITQRQINKTLVENDLWAYVLR